MKSKILSILAVIFVFVLTFSIVSCDDEDYTTIETQGLLFENGIYKITVGASQEDYDILSKITISEDAEFEFSANKDFSSTTDSGKITLKDGDNFIYLRVTDDNDHERTYTFNVYKKKSITVTFNPGEGTMSNTTTVVEEGTVISAPTANRVGHTLQWDYDFSKPITQNITINAIWTPYNCKVTTNVDGELKDYYVLFGNTLEEIIKPEKKGYNFSGWTYNGAKFDVTKPLDIEAESIELIAVFEAIVYNVQYVFKSDLITNNSNPLNFVIENGELDIELVAPIHSIKNYIFGGWYLEAEYTTKIDAITLEIIDSIGDNLTLTLYPKWSIVSNITYDSNEGTVERESDVFTVGVEYALPIPERENYIFDGWYNDNAKINNTGIWMLETDAKLVANWIPRQSSIEYILNGENVQNSNPNSYDIEDGSVELVPPVYDDKHEFAGWYSEPNFAEESKVTYLTVDIVGEELTLYAKWIYISTVTYDANEGICDADSLTIKYGEGYSLAIPTREKYKFVGWKYNNTIVNNTGKWYYETDVELVADWVPEEYKIVYELFGGTNNKDNLDRYTVETDPATLVLLAPEKQYCNFAGWYLDNSYTTPIESIDPTAYTGVTVYAKWDEVKVTFNYDALGGTISANQTVINLGESFVLLIPVNPGYKFEGWFVEDEQITDKEPWTDAERLELDLVAKWTLEEYDIVYDLDGGTIIGSTLKEKYTVLDNDFKLPIPTKSGFYFTGWSLNGGAPSASVVVTKGSTGHRSYKATWGAYKDEATGLIFSMIDDKMIVVGLERKIDDTIISGIQIPAQYNGKDVVAIDSGAFQSFGKIFSETSYANMSSSYVNIYVPTSVKRIGAKAFEGCLGIKVSLYNGTNSAKVDHEEWDKTVTWEADNISARDCIWGFRPAIGWTRYSQVKIPDDYE